MSLEIEVSTIYDEYIDGQLPDLTVRDRFLRYAVYRLNVDPAKAKKIINLSAPGESANYLVGALHDDDGGGCARYQDVKEIFLNWGPHGDSLKPLTFSFNTADIRPRSIDILVEMANRYEAKDVITFLAKSIGNDNPLIRSGSYETLKKIGENKHSVYQMRKALSDPKKMEYAKRLLLEWGPTILVRNSLVWALSEESSTTEIESVLSDMDPNYQMINCLVGAFSHDKSREHAIRILKSYGPNINTIEGLVKNLGKDFSEYCVEVLSSYGEDTSLGITLVEALKSSEKRDDAVDLLRNFRPARIITNKLVGYLSNRVISQSAIILLEHYGPCNDTLHPLVKSMASDDHFTNAVVVLDSYGIDSTSKFLIRNMSNPDLAESIEYYLSKTTPSRQSIFQLVGSLHFPQVEERIERILVGYGRNQYTSHALNVARKDPSMTKIAERILTKISQV